MISSLDTNQWTAELLFDRPFSGHQRIRLMKETLKVRA